jgi:hypothetical protein
MKVILAVDLGFGFTKAVVEYNDGTKVVRKNEKYPSIVKRKESVNNFGNLFGNADDFFVQAVNVSDGKGNEGIDANYYVGNSAQTNLGVRKWQDKGDFEVEDLIILLGTAVTLLVPEGVNDFELHLGLPMNYFNSSAESLYTIVESIKSTIKIKNMERHLQFTNISIKPQGIGAYFDICYDWNGRIRNPEIANSNIGIIMIGYRTVEYVLARNGRNGVQFIDDKMGSIEKQGMNRFFEIMRTKLLAQYKAEIIKEDIEVAIFENDCILNYSGLNLDLNTMVQEVSKQYIADVVGVIKPIWADAETTLNQVYLSGGSAPFLYDGFKGNFKNLILHGEETEKEKRKDAHLFSNANGFLKMAKMA